MRTTFCSHVTLYLFSGKHLKDVVGRPNPLHENSFNEQHRETVHSCVLI